MILKKNLLIDKFNQQKNNVIEEKFARLQTLVPEQSSSTNSNTTTLPTTYNEISRVKNILKMPTPLSLEPSLYSPLHPMYRDNMKIK